MVQGIHIGIHEAFTAGTAMGSVTLLRAGGICNCVGICVCMFQNRDLFGFGFVTDRTAIGFAARFQFCGFFCNHANIPAMVQSIHIVILVTVTTSAGIQGITLLSTGRCCYRLCIVMSGSIQNTFFVITAFLTSLTLNTVLCTRAFLYGFPFTKFMILCRRERAILFFQAQNTVGICTPEG